MCVHIDLSTYEKMLVMNKLTKENLDEFLAEQRGREYDNSLSFFRKFGLHLELDGNVSLMTAVRPDFVRVVNEFVATPRDRIFSAARSRLHMPTPELVQLFAY